MLREKLVSVKVRYSPRTIEVYGALVRTYRKVLGQYNPSEYLFKGQSGGMYSTSSIQTLFRKALKECKNNKKVTAHILRRGYAIHVLERGTDLRTIKEFLGHKSSKTTELLTYVSL